MIKYLTPREPKICRSCKLDLFKVPHLINGYVCGDCGQQYEIKEDRK